MSLSMVYIFEFNPKPFVGVDKLLRSLEKNEEIWGGGNSVGTEEEKYDDSDGGSDDDNDDADDVEDPKE